MTDFWTVRAATIIFAYGLAVGFLLLYATVVLKIFRNQIDLGSIIQEKDGTEKSSISRFQLLVFTLTIAGLYVILSIEAGALIDVPNGALLLLGISGGSFLMSKSIGTPTARAEEKKLDVQVEEAKAAAAQAKAQARE
jgi:hypothetical protein